MHIKITVTPYKHIETHVVSNDKCLTIKYLLTVVTLLCKHVLDADLQIILCTYFFTSSVLSVTMSVFKALDQSFHWNADLPNRYC